MTRSKVTRLKGNIYIVEITENGKKKQHFFSQEELRQLIQNSDNAIL